MSSSSRPPSSPRRTKFVVGALVVAGALFGLVGWAMSRPDATSFYVTVEELQAIQGAAPDRALRVNGNVVPGSIERRGLETTFMLAGGGARLRVHTNEPLPDAFRNGSEVVARGRYDGHSFVASEVLAKCPSKFKAA
jgi:cytochrome c-type biogenesis protein CcmE